MALTVSPGSVTRHLGSLVGQSVWDMWWTEWHWTRFFSECFDFSLSVLFYQWSIPIHSSDIDTVWS